MRRCSFISAALCKRLVRYIIRAVLAVGKITKLCMHTVLVCSHAVSGWGCQMYSLVRHLREPVLLRGRNCRLGLMNVGSALASSTGDKKTTETDGQPQMRIESTIYKACTASEITRYCFLFFPFQNVNKIDSWRFSTSVRIYSFYNFLCTPLWTTCREMTRKKVFQVVCSATGGWPKQVWWLCWRGLE